MAFFRFKSIIEDGDQIVVYLSRDYMVPLVVDATKVYHNRYGSFAHKNMIDLTPGKKMIETGTGSGSFSHSIARSLAPDGHLYTFEYHEQRYNIAKQEFQDHGIADLVTIQHRDVCKDGFGITNEVHAVFLDLPAPWEVVASARAAFQQNTVGRLCSFSPCIEQVDRTCKALTEEGFSNITMFEVLSRPHELRQTPLPSIQAAIARHQSQRESKAIVTARRYPTEPKEEDQSSSTETTHKKRKLETGEEDSTLAGVPDKSSTPSESGRVNLTLRPLTTEELNYQYVTKTPTECRGHTSYLTFATWVPQLDN
ncbi:tRNA (adenine-N(1)-)-methyltransferase catalytic subunit trm61 [Dispira parvispora]|uniref:tRNA (adenine(58)-N(1))-methyltransferase catalytic subunit TRM61 n=1 Tax=Dispira parvispora TaxID=1520584 RepID=A0A9W8ALI6_9FUNG|nr:tRNA (adenine-N(1)-)-methyltransferase catalytic subunit trm61 [Dispira parvispora]